MNETVTAHKTEDGWLYEVSSNPTVLMPLDTLKACLAADYAYTDREVELVTELAREGYPAGIENQVATVDRMSEDIMDWIIWTVEGEPYSGTIADYARSLEQGHYAGLDVSHDVWVWDPELRAPSERHATITASLYDSYDSDDWAHVCVFVNGLEAFYHVDGRA